MPQILHINSIDDLAQAVETLTKEPEGTVLPEVDPEFVLTIKVQGKTWDGFVDARVARYVTELQRTFDRTRRIAGLDEQGEKQLVKVKVKDGSTEMEGKVYDFLVSLIGNMTETQKFVIALVVIGVVFAGWSLKQVLAHLQEIQKRKLEHETAGEGVKALSENLRYALEKIDPERAVRGLVKDMRSEDRITLPAVRDTLDKDGARGRYPRQPRVSPIDVQIDDQYEVVSVGLGSPARLTLQKGGYEFKADFAHMLNSQESETFISRVKRSLETGETVQVALNIDARISDKIIHAIVTGIGAPPRPDARNLDELMS